MTREIPLTRGYVAIVDEADYGWLSEFKWSVDVRNRQTYAQAMINRKIVRMHRLIMDAKTGESVDHRDCNGLNNTRSNLRLATSFQQQGNRRKNTGSTSKYKGVYWRKKEKCWNARIQIRGQYRSLGCYTNEIDSALAYDREAKKQFGEFARLNFQEMP